MCMPTIIAFEGSLPASHSARASKDTQRGAPSGRRSGDDGARAFKYVVYSILAMIALLALAAGAVIYLVQPIHPAFAFGHRFPAVNWFSVKCFLVYYLFMVFYVFLYVYAALAAIKIATAIIPLLAKTLSKIVLVLAGWVVLPIMGFWFVLEDAFVYGKSFATAATDFIPVAWSSPSAVIANLAPVILRYIARFEFGLLVPYTAKGSFSLAASVVSRWVLLAIELIIGPAICKWGALEAGLINGAFSVYVQANLPKVGMIMERAFKEEVACMALLDLVKGPVVFGPGKKTVIVEPVIKMEPVECVCNAESPIVVQEVSVVVKAATKGKKKATKTGRKSRVPVDLSMLRRSARLANAH